MLCMLGRVANILVGAAFQYIEQTMEDDSNIGGGRKEYFHRMQSLLLFFFQLGQHFAFVDFDDKSVVVLAYHCANAVDRG